MHGQHTLQNWYLALMSIQQPSHVHAANDVFILGHNNYKYDDCGVTVK